MPRGESVFSEQEKEEVFSFKSFFENGKSREIVILDKTVMDNVSKSTGKPYKSVEWKVADSKTGEVKDVRFDFSFTNAMRDHKDVMKYETSVFRVTPVKTGERNDYDIFDYTVEYVGEDGISPSGTGGNGSATPVSVPF